MIFLKKGNLPGDQMGKSPRSEFRRLGFDLWSGKTRSYMLELNYKNEQTNTKTGLKEFEPPKKILTESHHETSDIQ